MLCLVCDGPLVDLGAGLWSCPACGYAYPGEVLADEQYERIRAEKLACTRCEPTLPGLPRVHVDRRGRPCRHPSRLRRLLRLA